jgi:hypothetical protein
MFPFDPRRCAMPETSVSVLEAEDPCRETPRVTRAETSPGPAEKAPPVDDLDGILMCDGLYPFVIVPATAV